MIKLDINNQTNQRVYYSQLQKAANAANKILKFKKNLNVSIGLVNKEQIKKLNKIYRNKDKATDVLSFGGEDDYLGEVIICLPIAKKQAEEFNHTFHCELQFLFIHGLLHLSGYDHKKAAEKKKMTNLEKKIMAKLC